MHLPVAFYLHRRQTLLFLIAIVIPCMVLVVLGLRIIAQERQLESKRHADERVRLVEQTRQDLLSELEKIKLREVTKAVAKQGRANAIVPAGPVAFLGPLFDGQLRLPWESSS